MAREGGHPKEQQTAERGGLQKVADWTCAELSKASLKCLDDNNYDKTKCVDAFEAYKNCKKQEVATRAQRRLEERQKKGGGGLFG